VFVDVIFAQIDPVGSIPGIVIHNLQPRVVYQSVCIFILDYPKFSPKKFLLRPDYYKVIGNIVNRRANIELIVFPGMLWRDRFDNFH